MNRHADLLTRVRAANPAPSDVDLPPEVMGDPPSLSLLIARRPEMVVHDTKEPETGARTASNRRRGVAIAAAVAVVAVAIAIPTILIVGGGEEAAAPSTSLVTTTVETPAATETTGTDTVRGLVDAYYDAYNSGDYQAAVDLLSPIMREVSPATMRYWVETLGERVEAECADAPDGSAALVCRERYTDPLHALSGSEAETVMRYAERGGLLLQNHDPSDLLVPGCQQSRCPGAILESDDEVRWSYEQIEIGFFAWLEAAHPDVASAIGDAGRLGYFSADAEATALALPFVEEFSRSGAIELMLDPAAGPDFTGMTTLEAVEAVYDVINSHDAEAFESFFGTAPDDPTAWFWAQGRVWKHDCSPVEGDGDVVRCSIAVEDDFYTRAGAIFEAVELWTMSGGQLFSSIESANSSGHWAYSEFERDYARWMRETHPDLAGIVFVELDLKHNAEAATIAVEYLDEFLEASETYPRDPDPRNDWRG